MARTDLSNDSVGSAQLAHDLALEGNPTAATQSSGNNTTRLATTAFVTTAVAGATIAGISSSADATAITIDSSERVGIGVSPSATLDVNGTIKLSGSHPVGTRNTALGETAFHSAQSGASYNVTVGFQAMYNNTTGTHNVGIG